MKKYLLATTLLGAAVVGLGTMNSVSAADTGKKTTATATFEAGENPDGGGSLEIKDATQGLDFGTNKISAADVSLPAKSGLDVTVSDLRGSFAGWNVSVSGTPLKVDSDGDGKGDGAELGGASLVLPKGSVLNGDIATDDITATGVDNLLDGSASINATAEKEKNDGAGTTKVSYAADGILLNVVGGSAHAAAYATTLTWTLTDAPK
ncbi:WxL domain-containing protein [Dellaglioa sp. BT-FLS60]